MPVFVSESSTGNGNRQAARGRLGLVQDGDRDAGLSTLHNSPRGGCRGTSTLSYTLGGSVCRLKVDGATGGPGGARGVVREFSAGSRRRLLRFLGGVDRGRVDVSRLGFVTLTYPEVFPSAPDEWERHLTAFRHRWERAFGVMPAVWKKEFQKRGAPHWHLLVKLPDSVVGRVALSRLRAWVSRAWFEVVGSGDLRHLKAGTQVQKVRTWRGAMSYAAKYLGKSERVVDGSTGEVLAVGRYWGVWRRDCWPVEWVTVPVAPDDVWRCRRVLWRLMRRRSHSYRVGCTGFVEAVEAQRVCVWLN